MSKFKEAKIVDIYSLPEVKGDFGIEIEMECSNPFPNIEGWRTEEDHSLKGAFNVEYVTRGALYNHDVHSRIGKLVKTLDKYGTKVDQSVRAGVHVHMNMQKNTLREVLLTSLLYYTFETALTRFCGPNRVGNHFCFRAQDAEYVLSKIETVMDNDSKLNHLGADLIRYSALNFNSLGKYGTLEFRAMETRYPLDNITIWCDMLARLKHYATKSLESGIQISDRLSADGPENFLRAVFGEIHAQRLTYPGVANDIMSDFRLIQHLLYKGY